MTRIIIGFKHFVDGSYSVKMVPDDQNSNEDIRAPERFLLKMPQNLQSYDKHICVSEGFGDQLSLCQPIEEGDEYEFINTMIDELNAKCGLELSHEYLLLYIGPPSPASLTGTTS